jgi:3-isopropylmalate/(R)-2-methylmalate dehydratase small subunit
MLTVDLETQTVSDSDGLTAPFTVDPFRRHCLLNGLDDIGLTLQHAADIDAFERRRPSWLN